MGSFYHPPLLCRLSTPQHTHVFWEPLPCITVRNAPEPGPKQEAPWMSQGAGGWRSRQGLQKLGSGQRPSSQERAQAALAHPPVGRGHG